MCFVSVHAYEGIIVEFWTLHWQDDILLRFALGRFFKEVVDDTRLMVEGRQPPQKRPFFFQLGLRGYLRGEAQAQAVEQAGQFRESYMIFEYVWISVVLEC